MSPISGQGCVASDCSAVRYVCASEVVARSSPVVCVSFLLVRRVVASCMSDVSDPLSCMCCTEQPCARKGSGPEAPQLVPFPARVAMGKDRESAALVLIALGSLAAQASAGSASLSRTVLLRFVQTN